MSICLHDHTLLYVINTETGLPTLEMRVAGDAQAGENNSMMFAADISSTSSFIILSFAQTTQCSMGTSQVTKI